MPGSRIMTTTCVKSELTQLAVLEGPAALSKFREASLISAVLVAVFAGKTGGLSGHGWK